MGARKSKMWDDYVEYRVREDYRRELLKSLIEDHYGQCPAGTLPGVTEGVYVVDRVDEESLVLGTREEEYTLFGVEVPAFVRRLVRANDAFYFRLVRRSEGHAATWIGPVPTH